MKVFFCCYVKLRESTGHWFRLLATCILTQIGVCATGEAVQSFSDIYEFCGS